MAIEYAVLADGFILYDGTNSAELVASIAGPPPSYWTTVEVTSEDEDGAVIFKDDGSSGTGYTTIPVGHYMGVRGNPVVSPADWASKYVKP